MKSRIKLSKMADFDSYRNKLNVKDKLAEENK